MSTELALKGQEGTITVPPPSKALETAASAETVFAARVLAGARGTLIADETRCSEVKSVIEMIRAEKTRIDDSRKTITAPLRQAEAAVNALLMPAVKDLDAAEKHLKGLIIAYVQKGKAAAVEAMQQIAAGADVLAVQMPTLPTGTHSVKRWKAEIVDAAMVPREYCSPDPDKINRLIETHKHDKSAVLSIPGVRFFEEESLTVRSAK